MKEEVGGRLRKRESDCERKRDREREREACTYPYTQTMGYKKESALKWVVCSGISLKTGFFVKNIYKQNNERKRE